jgi:hypothetical protein
MSVRPHATHRSRHQSRARSLKIAAALVPVALIAAGLGLLAFHRDGTSASGLPAASTPQCDRPTRVVVSTTPDFAPVVEQVTARLESAPDQPAGCPDYQVRAAAPVVSMDQVVTGGSASPDVWVPDSSLWVARANGQLGSSPLPTGSPVAQSPLVVAVPEARAAMYAGAARPSWQQLLGGAVPARMTDPEASTTGLVALLTVREALGQSPAVQQAMGGAMIRLSRTAARDVGELFTRAAQDKAGASGFPASEQQVMRYDAAHHDARLVPVVPQPGTGRLDYPFVTVPARSAAVTAAAADLHAALISAQGQQAVRKAGFRTPDGQGGAPDPASGVPQDVTLLPTPGLPEADAALRTWSAVSIDMRMIAAIDVSGSMTNVESNGLTRIALAQGATDMALRIFPPHSQVGLWDFSTNKGGPGKAYKQLVPLAQLDATVGKGSQRDALLAANAGLGKEVNGDTGLYDTILAAYETVKATYDPSKVNSVVVLTDGRNDNPGGLTLEQLFTHLRADADPARPVSVITVGMGPDADVATLDRISRFTGGKAYVARNPQDIKTVFIEALMQRQCRPNC